MGSEAEDIELIEKFLEGKLTHQELRNFNRRLDEDREFARKVRIRQTFPTLLSDSVEPGFQKNEPIPSLRPPTPGSYKWKKATLLVSLTLLVICLIVFVFLFSSRLVDKKTDDAGPRSDKEVYLSSPGSNPVPGAAAVEMPAGSEDRRPETGDSDTLKNTNAIELVVPEHEQTFNRNEAILFQWEQATDSSTNFYIVSTSGKKIYYWKGIKPGIHEFLLPARTFIPGRYVWFVGTRENKRSFVITD